MTTLARLRKKVGYAKWVVLDGGHREVRYKWRLERSRRQADQQIESLLASGRLKPANVAAESEVEVHSLCGHAHVTMGLWSLWSLMRWSEGRLALVVHSDGSLTEGDVARFNRFFPNARVVLPEESRAWAEARFGGGEFENLRAFRSHVFGPKLLDFHRSERARVIVMMDTDVLFFRRPDELLSRCLERPIDGKLTSFRDVIDTVGFMLDKKELTAALDTCGAKVIEGFNAGMAVLPRFEEPQFRFLERVLGAFKPQWRAHYFAEQTLYSIAAGEYGWHPLADSYQIGHETNTPDALSVHYVGNQKVRPRFYTEGIPRLVAGL